MAICKIYPIYKTLSKAINYIERDHYIDFHEKKENCLADLNRELNYISKQEKKPIVSTYMCSAKNAANEMKANQRKWRNPNKKVLARALIISFKPGEVTPTQAHNIVEEIISKALKGKYMYVHSTHTDREHLHSHIVFDNVSFIDGHCYNSNKKSYRELQNTIDKTCQKYQLSVINRTNEMERPSISHLYAKENKRNWKSKLKEDVDKSIKISMTWDNFIANMINANYQVKFGKNISFKAEDNQAKYFIRLKSLGLDYSEEYIKQRIDKNKNYLLFNNRLISPAVTKQQNMKAGSIRQQLKYSINIAINESSDWDTFLLKMKEQGWEINKKRKKYISFRRSKEQRFTRIKSCGLNYSEHRIRQRIIDKAIFCYSINNKLAYIDPMQRPEILSSEAFEKWAEKENITRYGNCKMKLAKLGIKNLATLNRRISLETAHLNRLKQMNITIMNQGKRNNDLDKQIDDAYKNIKMLEVLKTTLVSVPEILSLDKLLKKEKKRKGMRLRR